MNNQKIKLIEDRISRNRKKLMEEKNSKKREILRLRIGIDEYKLKLERLK
ncbi:MAG: hypothetical protein LW852_03600 [Sediminibacterium sp.]|jgi:hypothetical protein|nr:hypothetical protein [Sediminibacterium sp.]